ncbi:hypothetical protein QL898_06045 [Psychrobacter sp. APC 3279]|uniref:hypothetical protein n=1 Tax=Psychrobacter sp. APC 3279 TaxID=3035189 RepID=UPI0025B622FF|nr:hypothetical protein [Psychrobacter sp. APC 3279]MDN3441188.1 hypothetical protein [Psychrobacter sp. APC 3279]
MNSSYKKNDESLINLNLEVLGVRDKDIDSIVKETQNVKKMVFEQVFLVMLYTRQLMLHPKNGANVKARLKLIDIVFRIQDSSNGSEVSKVRTDILQMMEANEGSNDFIAYLHSLKLKNETNSEAIDTILSSIQEEKVAFAPLGNIHGNSYKFINTDRQYSYYEMYASLRYTMTIFQKFLNQATYDDNVIKRALFKKIKSKAETKDFYRPSSQDGKDILSGEQKKISDLLSNQSYAELVKEFELLHKKELLQDIRADIAIDLGVWATDIFRRIYDSKYIGGLEYSSQYNYLNNVDLLEIDNESEDNVIVSIDKIILEDIYKLNQLDHLADSIKNALINSLKSEKRTIGNPVSSDKEFLTESLNKAKDNNESALTQLSEWYAENSIGFFKKIDQIPKAIVSIINFDLYNPLSDVNWRLNDALMLDQAYSYKKQINNQGQPYFRRKSPIAEHNKLVTYLTSLFLHLKMNHSLISYQFFDLLQDIKKDNLIHFNHSDFFENSMMFSWSIFKPSTPVESTNNSFQEKSDIEFGEDEQNQMMYRFKKIPISVRNNEGRKVKILSKDTTEDVLEALVNFITNQPSTKPYPYNSSFPLPLRIRKR